MQRAKKKLHVDTFPFLAVLLCAMGSLILLLMVMDRRAKTVTRNKLAMELEARQEARTAESGKLRTVKLAELTALRQAEWEKERDKLHQTLLAQEQELRDKLAGMASEADGTAKKLELKQSDFITLQQKLAREYQRLLQERHDLTEKKTTALTTEEKKETLVKGQMQRLTLELLQMEKALLDLKELKSRPSDAFSLVPYRGKQGDNRRPVYVECFSEGMVMHPNRTVIGRGGLTVEQFRQEIQRRAVVLEREKPPDRRAHAPPPTNPNAYVLFLVRPEGVETYYLAQNALRGYAIDYGYELVESTWVFDFGNEEAVAQQPWHNDGRGPGKSRPLFAFSGPGSGGSFGNGLVGPPGTEYGPGSPGSGPPGSGYPGGPGTSTSGLFGPPGSGLTRPGVPGTPGNGGPGGPFAGPPGSGPGGPGLTGPGGPGTPGNGGPGGPFAGPPGSGPGNGGLRAQGGPFGGPPGSVTGIPEAPGPGGSLPPGASFNGPPGTGGPSLGPPMASIPGGIPGQPGSGLPGSGSLTPNGGPPGTGLAVLGLPGSGSPGSGGPGTGLPGSGSPTANTGTPGMPGSGLPGTGSPGSGLPGVGAPGTGMPGSGIPTANGGGTGLPGTGLPGSGLPGSGLPGSGAPGTGTGMPQVAYGQGSSTVGLPPGSIAIDPASPNFQANAPTRTGTDTTGQFANGNQGQGTPGQPGSPGKPGYTTWSPGSVSSMGMSGPAGSSGQPGMLQQALFPQSPVNPNDPTRSQAQGTPASPGGFGVPSVGGPASGGSGNPGAAPGDPLRAPGQYASNSGSASGDGSSGFSRSPGGGSGSPGGGSAGGGTDGGPPGSPTNIGSAPAGPGGGSPGKTAPGTAVSENVVQGPGGGILSGSMGAGGTPSRSAKPGPPPLGRLLANHDYVITVECLADGVMIYPRYELYPMNPAENQKNVEQALVRTIQQMIARRQASVRQGETAYRPMIQLQVEPDGLRSYYWIYPALQELRIPMYRENLEN